MNARTRLNRVEDLFPDMARRLVRPESPTGLSADGNFVSITAEVKRASEETQGKKGERRLVRELYDGAASRSFSPAHEADGKAAVAKFEDGIRKPLLPKKQGAIGKVLMIQ